MLTHEEESLFFPSKYPRFLLINYIELVVLIKFKTKYRKLFRIQRWHYWVIFADLLGHRWKQRSSEILFNADLEKQMFAFVERPKKKLRKKKEEEKTAEIRAGVFDVLLYWCHSGFCYFVCV